MNFKINFFSNMAGKPFLLTSNPSSLESTRKFNECTSDKVNGFAGGFFSNVFSKLSKVMGFTSFSFRMPTNLMDQFQRSADFYKKFPQLRPSFSDSGRFWTL